MDRISREDFEKQFGLPYLQELSVLGALKEDFIRRIIDGSDLLRAAPGEILFTRDQYTDAFYTIIDGRVCLYKNSRLHNEIINFLTNGESAGFVSMLCMHPLMGVVIEKESVLMRTSNEVFASLPGIDGEQFSILLMNLARNVGRAYIRKV